MSTVELDALLAGAAPRTDEERRLVAAIEALRAAAPARAPERLRTRVLALEAPPRRLRLPVAPRRRALLALVPVAAVLALAVAAVQGLRGSGSSSKAPAAAATLERQAAAPPTTVLQGSSGSSVGGGASEQPLRTAPAPAPGRLQRYEASITVRVGGDRGLGRSTNAATRIARSLGGYAASVEYRRPAGSPGEAFLELRVPTARVQDALARLASLGTLLSQQVSVRDLEQQLERQTAQIARLRRRVRLLVEALKSPSLTPLQRIRLRLELGDARRALAQRTSARRDTIEAGTLARISLVLTAERQGQAPPPHRSRLDRTLGSALSFLALEGTILLYALIVAGPLALLAALAWWAAAARRRREERRLLSAPS